MGIEPTRPNGHMALNHACLPIPAPRYTFIQTKKPTLMLDFFWWPGWGSNPGPPP